MKQKWGAFLSIIGLVLGLKRPTKRPFRARLMIELYQIQSLKSASEIRLNTLFIQIRNKDEVRCLMDERMPLTDEERNALKAVLDLILPKQTKRVTLYEPDVELSHQLTYRYTKTQA
jgi:hypothetical protein